MTPLPHFRMCPFNRMPLQPLARWTVAGAEPVLLLPAASGRGSSVPHVAAAEFLFLSFLVAVRRSSIANCFPFHPSVYLSGNQQTKPGDRERYRTRGKYLECFGFFSWGTSTTEGIVKDSLSLPGLAVWSSSAVMVPFGETEFVCAAPSRTA